MKHGVGPRVFCGVESGAGDELSASSFTCHRDPDRQGTKLRNRAMEPLPLMAFLSSKPLQTRLPSTPRHPNKTDLLPGSESWPRDYHHSQYPTTTIYGLCFFRRNRHLPTRSAYRSWHLLSVQRAELRPEQDGRFFRIAGSARGRSSAVNPRGGL